MGSAILDSIGPGTGALILGLLIGLAFGALAEKSRLCLRRSLIGEDRAEARGVWAAALAVAILGTQAAVASGVISFADHRFLASDLPAVAIIVGGIAFGIGMVLTRGCLSRLTVLAGTGNLRAALSVTAAAIVAHSAMTGILSPVRVTLTSWTLPVGTEASLAGLPGGALVWTPILAGLALWVAWASEASIAQLLRGALIGLLVPIAWVGTGALLADPFDPVPLEALSFTSPISDALFWLIASTSVAAGFGVAFLGGTLLGSLASATVGQRLAPKSFSAPGETVRYLSGAAMMGLGGVLAGGCTIGAGLSGIPTLSVAAILALASIAAGTLAAQILFGGARHAAQAQPT